MSEHVWMSTYRINTRTMRGFWTDLDPENPIVFTQAELRDTWDKNGIGVPLPADRFPTKAYWIEKTKFNKKLPQLFHSGFIYLNEKATNILQGHDLGDSALYPVQLYQNDMVTPIDADIKTLSIGNQKDTVLLDQCPRVVRTWPGHDFFSVPIDVTDDELSVSKSCLDGPDIWADPKMRNVFFVSDRLGTSLKKAGMKTAFDLVRCTVAT